jgi:hypothetical protein
LKREKDRHLAKNVTRTRRQNVVVAQTFSRALFFLSFFFFCTIEYEFLIFLRRVNNEMFIWLFVFFWFARRNLEVNRAHSCSFLSLIHCISLISSFI